MTAAPAVAATPPARKVRDPRNGLRTSATLATIFTIFGHTIFGFEQAVIQVFLALGVGYSSALFFEWVDARANARAPGYAGKGPLGFVDFLLSAHMTSITMSFLLYANEHLWVLAFAVALAIGSKYLFRVKINGRYQHFMNPSNFGISVVLFLFQYTNAIPWNFTEDLSGYMDWLVPLVIVGLGFRLNLLFTKRLPLIGAWLGTFVLQGVFRAFFHGAPIVSQLMPLTGIAMVLFTFYMITDPQTSPSKPRSQVIFGVSIGLVYALLLELHLMFTMFYAVALVTAARGVLLYVENVLAERKTTDAALAA